MRRRLLTSFQASLLLSCLLLPSPSGAQVSFTMTDAVLENADSAGAEDPQQQNSTKKVDTTESTSGREIRLAQAIRPLQPPPPPSAGVSAAPTTTEAAPLPEGLLGTPGLAPPPSTDTISGLQAKILAATDAGSLAGKSESSTNVAPEFRTPIVTALSVRGNHLGQLLASGSYWFPARQDLDTMLSKIDSRIVESMTVIKGPYSARYGPAFDFVNFGLLPAPRFPNGPESHGSSSIEYKTNGEQWYGRQSAWGGGEDWGVRIGYGHRVGSDYETGAGFELPSSYNSRNPDVAIGLDLTENSRLDFQYLRLDQTNVEFPGQFYDINYLGTDGYELTYVLEDQALFDRLTLEGWYNRTRFHGDNLRPGKRRQLPFLDMYDIKSFTRVSASSAGYSLAVTWGDPDSVEFTIGSDLRFLKQRLREVTTIGQARRPDAVIPPATSSDPGLFLDGTVRVSDRLTLSSGARMDWVSTDSQDRIPQRPGDDFRELLGALEGFDREFNLWTAYLTAQYELNSNWTAVGSFGQAMRPPTMTELYAVDPFVAALPQLVLTTVRGNPNLVLPRIWQIDFGLQGECGPYRGGLTGFHAWINNYITLEWDVDNSPPNTVLYGYVNTELATLAGGEIYGECDLSPTITTFLTASFVEGRDHTRAHNVHPTSFNEDDMRSNSSTPEEPLPAVPPLWTSLGIRIHEARQNPGWAVEFSTRIVDAQDRVATTLREEATPGFTLYNIRGYWQAFDDLLLTAGVENLSDKFYRTHFDTVNFAEVFQPGVNFYFGSELTY